MANIEKAEEVKLERDYNAQGVGLYRTEYMFLNTSRVPTEQEQFLAYKAVAEGVAPNAGGHSHARSGRRQTDGGEAGLFPKENNPFMGFRAIRFCLEHQDDFQGAAPRDPDGERVWQGAADVPDDQRARGTGARERRAWRVHGGIEGARTAVR